MDLNALLAKTETFMVSDSKGFGSNISYVRKLDKQNPITCRAIVSNSDIRGSKSKYAQNETIFYSVKRVNEVGEVVELGFEPRENDEIIYEGETFIVKPHGNTTASLGMYDIVTLSRYSLKHTRGR